MNIQTKTQNKTIVNSSESAEPRRAKTHAWLLALGLVVVLGAPVVGVVVASGASGVGAQAAVLSVARGFAAPLPSAVVAEAGQASNADSEQVVAAASRAVEQLKTFTNRDHFANVRAARPLVTDKYWEVLDATIASGEAADAANGGIDPTTGRDRKDFYGVVTRVVETHVDSLELERAQVTVSASREETRAGQVRAVYAANFVVTLERAQDTWLVDSITDAK